MNPHLTRPAALLLALTAWGAMTGCSAFKSVSVQERYFVLSPRVSGGATPVAGPATTGLAVGVGRVRVAAYLMPKAVAVRAGPNEVQYAETLFWAERLDKGAQRVLAMNLAELLPQATLKSYPWPSDASLVEVRVQLDRFDVDQDGQGLLEATWQIRVAEAETALRSGRSHFTLAGPAPSAHPDGAVATLSGLLGRLSEELADAVTQATVGSR